MKTTLCALAVLFATLIMAPHAFAADRRTAPRRALLAQEKGASRLMAKPGNASPNAEPRTFSSFDLPAKGEPLPAGLLKFEEADLGQVLDIYQEISGRTVIRSSTLPAIKCTLRNQQPATRPQALQLLDTLLAENGIVMVLLGADRVKAVPANLALTEPGPLIDLPREALPESSSYMTCIVPVKGRLPTDVQAALQAFAKMPNSILAINDAGLLVLRDYSANVRRMLEVLERLEEIPSLENRLKGASDSDTNSKAKR